MNITDTDNRLSLSGESFRVKADALDVNGDASALCGLEIEILSCYGGDHIGHCFVIRILVSREALRLRLEASGDFDWTLEQVEEEFGGSQYETNPKWAATTIGHDALERLEA